MEDGEKNAFFILHFFMTNNVALYEKMLRLSFTSFLPAPRLPLVVSSNFEAVQMRISVSFLCVIFFPFKCVTQKVVQQNCQPLFFHVCHKWVMKATKRNVDYCADERRKTEKIVELKSFL